MGKEVNSRFHFQGCKMRRAYGTLCCIVVLYHGFNEYILEIKPRTLYAGNKCAGNFCIGGCTLWAMTGISSAAGEGSMAIRFVRKYLQEM